MKKTEFKYMENFKFKQARSRQKATGISLTLHHYNEPTHVPSIKGIVHPFFMLKLCYKF